MSIYFTQGKGWRYDFNLDKERFTKSGFKTKKEAMKAMIARKEEKLNPKPVKKTPTDMDFLTLVNKRMDYIKVYNSEKHFRESVYFAKKWIKRWKKFKCSEITTDMIEKFIIERSLSGKYAANTDLRLLRATFNFGIKKKFITNNPTNGIAFLPVDKGTRKYIPTHEEIDKVIAIAEPDTQDYLWTIRETMARVGEINSLTWSDVDLNNKCVILKTRKKKGGNLTPRSVPMTQKLFEVLSNRFADRNKIIPWVFYHRVWSKSENKFVETPYVNRSNLMQSLCKKAGVTYFKYHALRHSGASLMDSANVPIGSIQRILGHEDRKTTEIYLHSIGNSEREAIKIFERARQNSHTDSHTLQNTV